MTDKEHFCGSIRYFTLEGEFLYGEIFEEGKRTATIAQHLNIMPGTAEADSILLRFKEKEVRADSLLHFKTRAWEKYCEWIPYWVSELVCTGVYINENYMENCEYSDVRGHYEYEQVCYNVYVPDPPTDPGPGYGGGGGTPVNPPDKDKDNDKPQNDPSKELTPAEAKTLADTIQHFSQEDKKRLVEIANKINGMTPFKKLIDYMSNILNARFSLMIIDPEHFKDLAPSLEAICEYYHSCGIGKLYFKEEINARNFMHEYFHLFQYSITNSEASTTNRGMMEVKRMIAIDIMTNVYLDRRTIITRTAQLTLHTKPDKTELGNKPWINEYETWIEQLKVLRQYPKFLEVKSSCQYYAKEYLNFMNNSDIYKNEEYGKYSYINNYEFKALEELLTIIK